MSQNLTVSVIIPTYNRAHLVGRAIKSVLNQTYENLEVIIVDDSSSDDTKKVVEDFTDQRIKYLCHQENKGMSAARNTGIRAASGSYIGFLDSDDEWLPQKLEKQLAKFKGSSSAVGVIYCGHLVISDKTGQKVRQRLPVARGNVYTYALGGGFVGGCTSLVKAECFNKCGFFDESLSTAEDWEMFVRLAKSYEFDFVDETLVKSYIHGKQMSTTLDKKIQAREVIIKRYHSEFLKNPSIYADNLNRLGVLYALCGNPSRAKEYFLESIRKELLQRFAYAHLIGLILFPKIYKRRLSESVVKIDGVDLYW